jgi:DeoR/GlpR family transcriptional regulator of sugar metabolism
MGKRDTEILDILNAEGKIGVTNLAERLGVSAVTMRKDLDNLAAKGIVQRKHGFAALGNPDDIKGRLARHYEKKLAIAKRAAQFVQDSDTVLIENGSCCALLARAVAEQHHDVTIVTNSVFVASYIQQSPSTRIVLLGGTYQAGSQATVGPMLETCMQDYFVPLMFIGADGWAGASNFTDADYLRTEAVRNMARQAGKIIVLTESEKFSTRSVAPLHLGNKIFAVVTDEEIPDSAASQLQTAGIKLITTTDSTEK